VLVILVAATAFAIWARLALGVMGATPRSVLRTRDFGGRKGGEEFAVLLPGSDVSVTASIGVAGFPEHASTLDRLERLADAALYLAKRQGRDRVELAEPATPAGSALADAVPSVPSRGSAPPTGRGRSGSRAWSAGRWPRPSRRCRAARRWSVPPS
jgi:hypothetical protein